MEILIKNGCVVTSAMSYRADVSVINGRIATIGTKLTPWEADCRVIDASGLLVLPGAIDVHTHLEMDMMGGKTRSADSYETGTRAAACGGVTTVFDYTLQEKGGSILDMIKERQEMCARSACIDYAFHGGISQVNDESLCEMADVVRYGVPSFKVYMVYDFGLDDAGLFKVLKRSRDIGALITVHAENKGMIDVNVEEFKNAGMTDAYHHYMSRPEWVEEEADFRAITLAKAAEAPLYIVHLANEGGAKLVSEARAMGYPILAETCPQYLNFTSEVYKRPNGVGFLCSPPIKGEESRRALWNALRNGDIQVVATDHCPSQFFEKEWGRDDFTKAPNGCMGIENMYPYMLSEANKGRITFEKAVEVCAENPAKIFGCSPRKGTLIPGADADIVLYDPKAEFTITKEKMHSAVDYTIWEGVKLKGYPVLTMVRGNIVYDKGEFIGQTGTGEFVRRRPYSL